MNRHNKYTWWVLPLLTLLLAACGSQDRLMNKRVTLWQNDDIRYGTMAARDFMDDLFPDAYIRDVKTAPGSLYVGFDFKGEIQNARVIIGPKLLASEEEWQNMLGELCSGTDYFISTHLLSQVVKDSLHLELTDPSNFSGGEDSMKLSVYDPETFDEYEYTYPGYDDGVYISDFDSSITTILGMNAAGKPNFARFEFPGNGYLYLHTAPLAFSNFFLLHKQNAAYFEKTFSWMRGDKTEIEWDDYFRNRSSTGDPAFSRLQVILKEPALRRAFWIVVLIFVLIYLLETKRKQSVIPVVAPLKTSSVAFAETISALYFNKHDNKNLAEKMNHQLAEHIYRKYFLKLSLNDPAFPGVLAGKTGMEPAFLNRLLYLLKMAEDYPQVSDEMLLELNEAIQLFYKNEQNGA